MQFCRFLQKHLENYLPPIYIENSIKKTKTIINLKNQKNYDDIS